MAEPLNCISSAMSIKKTLMRICTKGVTPERFYRGSTVLLTTTLSHVEWVGGPVPDSPGFPIEAFGNDRLLEL